MLFQTRFTIAHSIPISQKQTYTQFMFCLFSKNMPAVIFWVTFFHFLSMSFSPITLWDFVLRKHTHQHKYRYIYHSIVFTTKTHTHTHTHLQMIIVCGFNSSTKFLTIHLKNVNESFGIKRQGFFKLAKF